MKLKRQGMTGCLPICHQKTPTRHATFVPYQPDVIAMTGACRVLAQPVMRSHLRTMTGMTGMTGVSKKTSNRSYPQGVLGISDTPELENKVSETPVIPVIPVTGVSK